MSAEFESKPKEHLDETEFEASLVSGSETGSIGGITGDISVFATSMQQEASPPRKPPPWAGKILGHFKLLRPIGEGRMGMVIQALDVNLNRIVALKVLNKRLPSIGEGQRVLQFLREARAASQIEHPNVVRIYEINQHSGWWYIAMELLEGGNLRSAVKACGRLTPPRACALIADAATALSVAHSLGIIHRDVKPTNLMLTRQGRCKLTDFGLVRIDDPNDPFDFTNKAVGTPQFMAPEMISRKPLTPAVDVYSLGCTLFYALTGDAPYTGTSVDEVLKKHLNDPVPDVRRRCPECLPSLAALITRVLAKDPAERPSAADMASALRAELVSYPVDDSSAFSDVLSRPSASGSSVDMLTPEPSSIHTGSRPTSWFLRSPLPLMLTVLVVVVTLGGLSATGVFRNITHHRQIDPATFFPGAAPTYGIVPVGSIPASIEPVPSDRLTFSWAGKIDARDFRFVAARTGQYYYPVDSPQALLIRADSFVGYKSAAEAAADGKSPAPQ